MKILITGGAGFIGSRLALRLAHDNEIVIVDNLTTGTIENIPDHCTFIEGDVGEESTYEKLKPYQFEAIYHIAGQSSGEISYDDPVYDLNTNTKSTLLLLDFASSCGCGNFIYMSSMSVYGDNHDSPAKENDEKNPKSFYGVGKLASEHYLRINEDTQMKKTVLRLCNTYGPGQNMNNLRQGMVSIFIKQAVDEESILVKGSADRFRDFIHIDDVLNVLEKLLFDASEGFEIFNLTGGIKRTVGDLVRVIVDTAPGKIITNYEGSTPGDQHGICGDNSKIKSKLAWSPKINFEEGISSMVKWYSEKK
ncbi:GDP-mannose 4,6-dehydratase [bacterium]|nr:GDP-mannose 4,6-dehydratase [bacterium]